jgi:hypothetical protein
MATTTLQTSAVCKGSLPGGEAEMYQAFAPAEMGGELNGDGGYSFKAGGGGHPFGSLGQPRQGGGSYGGPPGGPPGGPLGGGGGMLGWGAGVNQPLALQG